jgi:hypothetical protein
MAGSRIPGPIGVDPKKRSAVTPPPLGVNDAASPDAPQGLIGDTPGPLGVGDSADPTQPLRPGTTLMMAKPPHFPQSDLTCWASAIASWYRVKGFDANITDQTLINHYKGTDCVDENGSLIGDTDADIEAVYAEWRLQLKISAEVAESKFTFAFVKELIENHGHFVLATREKSLMHSMVVYGARWNDTSDPRNFTLFVEDPMASDNEKHSMFIERPIRVALGTERSAGPAPCSKKKPG